MKCWMVNKILSYLTMMSLNSGFYYFKISKRRKFLNRQACMILHNLCILPQTQWSSMLCWGPVLFVCLFVLKEKKQTIGSLSTRVFETRTATGREHFPCQDRIVSQIFILLISNGGKILSNVNVVVRGQVKVKIAHFRLPSVPQKRTCLSSLM